MPRPPRPRSPARLAALALLVCACRAASTRQTETPKLDVALEREPGDEPPPKPPPPGPPAANSLPDGSPGLLVINDSDRDIDIYTAYVIDRAGELGTRVLWPHKHDCEGRTHLTRIVPKDGGRFTLPPPSRTFAPGGCEPGPPLPPGDYVVSIDSGYSARLHAAAPITLPMSAPVELRIEQKEDPIPCTAELGRRAVNLLKRQLKHDTTRGDKIPPRFLDGCDLRRPQCVESGEFPALPPARCVATLFTHKYGATLRVLKPPGDDALRGLSMELDHDVIHGRDPSATRSSSARFDVEGHELVIAGTNSELWHEHGGDAARVDQVTLRVRNPAGRPVAFQVVALEWLRSFGCELPEKTLARPAIRKIEPQGTLPPGESELTIWFEDQGAYQSHCDRFAARARVVIGGVERAITAEYYVGRFDPIE